MSSLTTKKAIANSFKELLNVKPFNKITINDIARNCDINRQTFYYHFEDIVSLVEWIWLEKIDSMLNKKDDYKKWEDKFLAIFKFMEDEKKFVINIYNSVSVEIFRKSLYKLVYPVMYDEILKKTSNRNISDEDVRFITVFYMYAFVSIVLDWVEKDMKEDPSIIVKKVSNLVTGTIEHVCNTVYKR